MEYVDRSKTNVKPANRVDEMKVEPADRVDKMKVELADRVNEMKVEPNQYEADITKCETPASRQEKRRGRLLRFV
jgi:hypothetical protein